MSPPDMADELARLRAENADLRRELHRAHGRIRRLARQLGALRGLVGDLFAAPPWLLGKLAVRILLKLLRRPFDTGLERRAATLDTQIQRTLPTIFQSPPSRAAAEFPAECEDWFEDQDYHAWFMAFRHPDTAALATYAADLAAWPDAPRVAVPVEEPDDPRWQGLYASLKAQVYPHWQLSSLASLAEIEADWVMFPAPSDRLAPDALYHLLRAAPRAASEAVLIYCDEDRLDAEGRHCAPAFKPDWDEDLFFAQNYIGRALLLRRTAVLTAGELDAGGLFGLILRISRSNDEADILHVPRVLYHRKLRGTPRFPHPEPVEGTKVGTRRVTPESVGGAQQPRPDLCAVLQNHLQRRDKNVSVTPSLPGCRRVRYSLPAAPPPVSIVVPTREHADLLRNIARGVLYETDYPHLELIVVDNGSRSAETLAYLKQLDADPRVRLLRDLSRFNYARLNNQAARLAQGEVLAFLNNDLQVLHPDWLDELVSQALRPEIGAVGAKLLYPERGLQHAGLVLGIRGLAGHAFKGLPYGVCGDQGRPHLVHACGAVTGACLAMRREVFEEIDGFDENLAIAFNDVDLCLRLRQRGYRVLYTPHAELLHLESASRGLDTTLRKHFRLRREIRHMQRKWTEHLRRDPYYNPNLSLDSEQYELAWPPRED